MVFCSLLNSLDNESSGNSDIHIYSSQLDPAQATCENSHERNWFPR